MTSYENIVIYHIYRKDGGSLFLHPFENPEKLMSSIEKNFSLSGKYGQEPRVETLTMFRNELYRLVEQGVKDWISDQKFIPRFLISAGVFLGGYFLFSFAIRDPLPMIDELLIALAAAIATYFFLGRKDLKSDAVLKRRATCKTAVDGIVFEESEFLEKMEAKLQEREDADSETLIESLWQPLKEPISQEEVEDAKRIIGYLEQKFSSKDYRKHNKKLKKLSRLQKRNKNFEQLKHWADSRKVDLSLFAFYTNMKQSVSRQPK
ncbi:MAG: hypothetical protein K9L68_01410 [Spirochaetales bacterium]|nr:hypothetical protein [Spirochaetales bacterium]